jgi:hypothetical protein
MENPLVEGREPRPGPEGKLQEVRVRDLPMSREFGRVHELRARQRDVVREKDMIR